MQVIQFSHTTTVEQGKRAGSLQQSQPSLSLPFPIPVGPLRRVPEWLRWRAMFVCLV